MIFPDESSTVVNERSSQCNPASQAQVESQQFQNRLKLQLPSPRFIGFCAFVPHDCGPLPLALSSRLIRLSQKEGAEPTKVQQAYDLTWQSQTLSLFPDAQCITEILRTSRNAWQVWNSAATMLLQRKTGRTCLQAAPCTPILLVRLWERAPAELPGEDQRVIQ